MTHDIQYAHILDGLLTAIVILDEDLSIIYLNAAAEDLLSVSGERLQGQSIKKFFLHDDDTPYALQEAFRGDKSFTKRRTQLHLHNRHEITVDYSVTPDSERGQIVVELQTLDRLLRISREEAWQDSHETTNHMVRSMAHEIKNPLGGIRGAAQLLARELGNSELEEFTRIIIDETDRLTNLTNRMLGPTEPVRHQLINIHEVLERVSNVIKLELPNSIKIHKDYDPSIPDLLADPEQLIQALLNILRNAMQALTENNIADGRIKLRTRVQRRYTIGRKTHNLVARISITDNGPGVPADMTHSIFYPMITGRAEGTGLGLAIVQNLIHRHEGFIECDSEPGNTEFIIYLPLGIDHAKS
ncbi:MAG: two-component system nitrogen regulation sensor histidine kinase GlnL [Flavobacteriales bacterium]|jgi:two-component system nitrogen regulation sensor histidine kinase GlnL